jgi:CRISPR-associated protein Csx3
VILFKDENEIVAWKELCESLNLQVVAIIFSDYHGTEDLIELETPILQGKVHCLQRGVDASGGDMVKALAGLLASKGV